MSETKFAQGLFMENPNENAPDFVMSKMSIKVDEFVKFLQAEKNSKGYVNLDVLKSREGKPYAKVNDWQPEETTDNSSAAQPKPNIDLPPEQDTPLPF